MKPTSTLLPFLALAGSSVLAISSVEAQTTLFWSANGTSQGGAGTWDITNASWGAVAAGPYASIWNNSNNDTAVFGSTAGTVTLGTGITAGGLTFNTNNYIISGGILTLAGASTPIINVTTGASTISSQISGSVGLEKTGAGVLLLNGTTSNYTGGTVITAGRLNAASDAALGNSTGSITLNGGTLGANGTTGTARQGGVNLTGARDVIVGASGGSIFVSKNNNFTTTGALSGSGTFTTTNPGGGGGIPIYRFSSSANTFTGAMTLNTADVRVSSLGDTAGNNIVFTSTSESAFRFNDTGATTGLTFSNRAFELNNVSATIDNLNTTHALTINSHLLATGAAAKTLTLGSVDGPRNAFNGNLTDGTDGGTIALSKVGAGDWVLGGSNSYTGGTSVTVGGLTFLQTGSKSASGTHAFSAGTTLGLGVSGASGFTSADVVNAFAGTVSGNLAGITVTSTTHVGVDTTNGDFTIASDFGATSAKNLVKLGNNTLTLTGTTSYTGVTIAKQGTLQFGTTASMAGGTTGNWIAARFAARRDTTLAFNVGGAGEFTTGNVATLLTNLAASSNINNGMNAGSSLGFDTTNATGTFTIGNVIADTTGTAGGTRGLTKLGTGTLELTNSNTYSGATTVSAGTLYVTGALSNSAVTVEANGTVGSNGVAGTLGNGLAIAAGGNLDLAGATIASSSTGILSLTGGSLTLGNFTFQDIVGWDWLAANEGTYELIDGSFAVDFGSTAFTSVETAYDFGNGKKGYFTSGSLNAVIVAIPEPGAALLGAIGLISLLRRRR